MLSPQTIMMPPVARQRPASGPPVARRPRPPVTPPAAPSLVAVGVGSAGRAHCRCGSAGRAHCRCWSAGRAHCRCGSAGRAHCRCLRLMTWGLGVRGSNGPGAGACPGDSVVKPCQPTCFRHPGGIHSSSALFACLLKKMLNSLI
jgi:hypothetical protein